MHTNDILFLLSIPKQDQEISPCSCSRLSLPGRGHVLVRCSHTGTRLRTKFLFLPFLDLQWNVIDSFSQSTFSSKSSRHHKSQTVRARELKFGENVHPSPCVTCQMSRVTCLVSGDRCKVSGIIFFTESAHWADLV